MLENYKDPNVDLRYVGREINLMTIRDAILDHKISDQDYILLNNIDFDNLILEYREAFGESWASPFEYLGILIKEDGSKKVPLNRIGIVRGS